MVYALLGLTYLSFLLGLILSFWMLRQQQRQHFQEKIQWQAEKERLLNRLMTHSWQDYVQATASMTVPSSSPLTSEDRGLSDDVELQRAGLVDSSGLGEVILDYGDDHVELGFVTES